MQQRFTRKPIKIRIVELPNCVSYTMDTLPAISFAGLLCDVVFEDGTSEFLDDQYLDCSELIGEYPGIYKIYVYLDEEHSYGICTTFKIRIEDTQIIDKIYEKVK